MNEEDGRPVGSPPGADLRNRPSRARYDKIKSSLDMKWRRRAPQAERIMREVVDALWDSFAGSPWLRCGLWILQPDGKAFQPGPARPEPAPAAVACEGPRGEVVSSGRSCLADAGGGFALYVPVHDKNGKPWAVFEAFSPAPFDEMDARWVERLFKIMQTIERREP